MGSKGSVIAIDWGTKKSGLAVSDPLRIALEPLEACRAPGDSEALLQALARLFEDREVGTFLVGLPRNMDGTDGAQAAKVRAFAARLAERFPEVDLVLWDERLSTKEAEEWLREEGVPPGRRRALRDSYSAMVLLRDWLRAGEPGPGQA